MIKLIYSWLNKLLLKICIRWTSLSLLRVKLCLTPKVSFSNRQRNKNYSDFNIPIKRHRHRMLSFFLLFLHVQPKRDTYMNKNVRTPMNNPSHTKIWIHTVTRDDEHPPRPFHTKSPFPVIGDLRCGQNYIPAGWSHKQSGQGRPGGVVVYQYTQKNSPKYPKIPQIIPRYILYLKFKESDIPNTRI